MDSLALWLELDSVFEKEQVFTIISDMRMTLKPTDSDENVKTEASTIICQERSSWAIVAMTQLQKIAIDDSDVNLLEKLLSDGGSLPGRARSTTDSEYSELLSSVI